MIDTKRLRQKILDLAIRGKLVPQDPADEPASVLLERIRAEKLQMVADGKLKKKDIAKDSIIYRGDDNSHYEKIGDSEPVCIDDELPFELPNGWEWARLGTVFRCFTGSTPSTKHAEYYGVQYPLYKPTDLDAGYETSTASSFLSDEGMENARYVTAGSVLVTCIGATIGKCGFVRVAGSCNQQINVIEFISHFSMAFMYYMGISEFVQQQIRGRASATTLPILNLSSFVRILIPIPPLAEQRRIVDALDEYLGYVDEIERSQAELESLLAKARSKVLDLAIRGKLVPQDSADEPASVLLERIRAEKLQMVADGKLKKKDIARDSVIYRGDDNSYYEKVGDDEAICVDDELPFVLPNGWEWARIRSFARTVSDGDHNPPKNSGTGIPLLSAKNVYNGIVHINEATRFVTEDYYERTKERMQLCSESVLLTIVGAIGRSAVLQASEPVFFQRSVCVINPVLLSSYYVSVFLESQTHYLKSLSIGTAQKGVYLGTVNDLLVPIPPLAEQRRINVFIQNLIATLEMQRA